MVSEERLWSKYFEQLQLFIKIDKMFLSYSSKILLGIYINRGKTKLRFNDERPVLVVTIYLLVINITISYEDIYVPFLKKCRLQVANVIKKGLGK